MQMWRFACRIAASPHAPNNVAFACKIASFGVNMLQVRVIMNAPFWPKHRHYIAAHGYITSVNHQANVATNYARASWCKNINAFMHARFAPRRKPKTIHIPIFVCSAFHWHSPARGQQQPKREDASEYNQYALFHAYTTS